MTSVAVIGGGPAGLMAAETLAAGGVAVTVYDRMPSVGRKFLLAGRGGLNLTHSEDDAHFIARYGAASPALADAIAAFPPHALRAWCDALGEPTFVGSSGRIFPRSLKSSPLLRAWLRRLNDHGVRFATRHAWAGWDDSGALMFTTPDGPVTAMPAATIVAMGGASWPRLGGDGGWVAPLAKAGIAVAPLQPANVGLRVAWTDVFKDRHEGQPLKRIALSFRGATARGEAMVTRDGLEGGAVYSLGAPLREAVLADGAAVLHVALRPDMSVAQIVQRLSTERGKASLATTLRKALKLPPVAIGLLHEAMQGQDTRLASLSAEDLATLINAVPVRVVGFAPIERAISTAGGVTWPELDASFMLRRKPGTFVAGEMLDWEAPTGGYLLQACFATGRAAGQGALDWLARPRGSQGFSAQI